jgi:hypothetical protein
MEEFIMAVKSVWLAGLLVLGACAANAQTGPIYWSTNANLNCGSFGTDANGTPLKLTTGPGIGGYVCYVYGTLPWYDSGAGWGSSIRVSAPALAPVAYFFDFSDVGGVASTLDFIYEGDPKIYSDVSASQALFANQPLEVKILGLSSLAPSYATSATGPVTVLVYCPDANTCGQAQAQLIYSALPSQPWSLSVPVVWDWQTSLAWSVVGIDGGLATSTDQVSFVIYNLDTATTGNTTHTYTINVYDADGKLNASTVTAAVPAFGSYANVLRNLLPNLPSGAFKLQVVSTAANAYTAFEALQFHGPSATALVSTAETVPTAAATTNSTVGRARHPSPWAVPMVRSHAATR